jgi:hypothetical protein
MHTYIDRGSSVEPLQPWDNVSPRYRFKIEHMMGHMWLSQVDKYSSKILHKKSCSFIMMNHMGYHAGEIQDSLLQKKFNNMIAKILSFQHQTTRESCTTQVKAEHTEDLPCLHPTMFAPFERGKLVCMTSSPLHICVLTASARCSQRVMSER